MMMMKDDDDNDDENDDDLDDDDIQDFVSEPGYSTTLGFKSLSDENGNFEIPNIMICDPYPWKASAIKGTVHVIASI